MFYQRKLIMAALILTCSSLAVLAQDRGDRTITCASTDGRRTFCNADTRDGVRIARQIGNVRCVEGYTWGFSEQGVWVDRGCQAEFVLPRGDSRANWERSTRIEPGTVVAVRTDEPIDAARADGRIFTGVVDQDVRGSNGRLAIPRGSSVELIVRSAPDRDLILDLESVVVNGQ